MAEPKKKQSNRVIRFLMTLLTVVLIFLFFDIMKLVSDIQGTARVVNYAGLVRGTTQRIVKLEDAQEQQNRLIDAVDSYINGLRYGSDELDLVRLDDEAFQNKMEELSAYYDTLTNEIAKVREEGYESTNIIAMSETFFGICDEATKLAETYSQEKATALNQLETVVIIDIVGLVLLFGVELAQAIRVAAQNRVLQKKVYLDEATGLPNKNKCEELLANTEAISKDAPVALCMFDLNNLRTINNNFGHEKGDEYIRSFALQLQGVASSTCFVGRQGGDSSSPSSKTQAPKPLRLALTTSVPMHLPIPPSIQRCPSATQPVTRFPPTSKAAPCASCSAKPTRTCTSTRTAQRSERKKSATKPSGAF